MEIPTIPTITQIMKVDCKQAFNDLTLKEKLYSYYFTRASWSGCKICYFQRSYESPALFYLFQKIFIQESTSEIEQKLKTINFSDLQINQIFVYIASFFQNCGNYKSFGDSKFIPEISKEKFLQFIQSTKAYQLEKQNFDFIWDQTNFELYHYEKPYYHIDFINNNGISSYYSSNITQQEAELINKFMEQQEINISPLNTRLLKHSEKEFEILIASVSKYLQTQQKYTFQDVQVVLTYGDFAPFMEQIYQNLSKSISYCQNKIQEEMITSYLKFFNSGNNEYHKDSQRAWIKDKGPIIETNIGFIESYLDPLKVRAEFEGFVSIVNKFESVKLEKLVEEAEKLITHLPWPKEFEVEKFTKPDFTSLEILSFACSGTPVGINIPNYDDIRQTEGFKNVNLQNIYGTPKLENIIFSTQENANLMCKYYKPSLFLIVALHELLGHGTGKLLQKDKDGKLNFDKNLKNPFTNENINTLYDVNETWHSKFGEISSGYEECKADSVALYLSCFQECLDILIPEFSKEEQQDIVYIAWYEIIYSAIKGLEYYDPNAKKWGQSHILAGYAIMQVLLEAGEGLVRLEVTKKNDNDYVFIHLDRNKISTIGKQVIGKFLLGLQVYKSIGDNVKGSEFFNKYSQVNDQMLQIRKIAIENKQPRRLELQNDVKLIEDGQNVEYVEFNETFQGIIKSQVFHYGNKVDDVYSEWKKYANLFRLQQK
ncbi:hypothetical protein IMG5_149350 [Ichthyophthirius multifiliis]|uniref:Dipeptidyl peptidase 3 n=1 Tax=Ichthyophthirius multifiliis TaxID=5932 RepID=G0QYG5_ICHMU|nr:hypothetical protein IMG5_149350 [Ichthyophthirius multifiliis]EGR29751.1 hypothetical protein IMG5_149350 [Ichthyophthirius multifiliis]|eukprot:XP_004030987.1 hypothetical protein IMG5_149350 [Ichthyophthirius multifiliis]